MKRKMLSTLVGAALVATAAGADAQVAGVTTGVALVNQEIALGWSAKKNMLGKNVYNERNEKIGTISDLIVAPDTTVSYVIVGAGGFVGLGKHDVAIDVTDLEMRDNKFVLEGATKDSLKAMRTFEYSKPR